MPAGFNGVYCLAQLYGASRVRLKAFYAVRANEKFYLSPVCQEQEACRDFIDKFCPPLKVPPISQHGNVNEIIGKFGSADQFHNAVNQVQTLLYAV
jgi:hypothetical protein